MMCIAVVSVQWFFWGFSLTFSENASPFIGNLGRASTSYTNDLGRRLYDFRVVSTDYIVMRRALGQPSVTSPRIPTLIFSIYQLMFAAITYVTIIELLKPQLRLHLSGP